MTNVQRHALVRHSAARMFGLVNDVEAYPRRFAWCEGAEIIECSETEMIAKLVLRAAGLRVDFTTRNTLTPPNHIHLQLVDGPFQRLTGLWTFHTLAEGACKVSLALDFDISTKWLGSAFAMGFHRLADRLVDDFCREADRSNE